MNKGKCCILHYKTEFGGCKTANFFPSEVKTVRAPGGWVSQDAGHSTQEEGCRFYVPVAPSK
jgi:hypothetical protein